MSEYDPDFLSDRTPADDTEERTRRSEPRDSLFLQAVLLREGDEAPITVRVRNLSPGGMMAELGTPFEPGDRLSIDLRGVGTVDGEVRWREAGRLGIAFDAAIDPQRARKTVGQRSSTLPPVTPPRGGPRRPKLFG